MTSFLERIGDFFHTGMWKSDTRQLSRWEAVLHGQARLWFMIGQRSQANQCFTRASALAFTSAFAIVPVLVVVFWLFGGVQSFQGYAPVFAERIVEYITIGVPGERVPAPGADTGESVGPDLPLESMEANIRQMLEALASDVVGSRALNSVSVALIILITVSLLSTIEMAFNDIWGIKRGRSLIYKSNLYLGTLVMLIILAGISFGLRDNQIVEKLRTLPYLGSGISILGSQLFRLLAFTFLFVYMPYTRISWRAGLAGGVFASALVQVVAWAGIVFNTRVVTWGNVYGPLAGIPVTLFGLYIIWTVILLGAEVTYAIQNLRTYAQERRVGELTQAIKECLALKICLAMAEAFSQGAEPLTGREISDRFDIPPGAVNEITHRLVLGSILVETEDAEGKLVPRQDLRSMEVNRVVRILRKGGDAQDLACAGPASAHLDEAISAAEETMETAYGNMTFGDLLAAQGTQG
ncbi:MAG: YihY/virulence factor BrkB family protein [Candidatus Eisenbacteria sp.]|nr:YihY/virulence factor BrkB family protein [Candidatus Eisenbacteria bacterium]